MALKDIGAIEALLGRAATARTEAADHGTFVVSQGVPVLVVFASKPLEMVFARGNGTLLRALVLVRKKMSFKILHVPAT